MKQAMIDYSKDSKNPLRDECYTPKIAVDVILKYIPKGLKIWEPSDTSGKISSTLIDNGHVVIGTCTDFFETETPKGTQAIITNPPYSQKDKWIRRCFEIGLPFALLLPLTALEGIERGKMYRQYGISLIVMDRRMNFTGGKGAWFNTSWFCHGFGSLPKNCIEFAEVKND